MIKKIDAIEIGLPLPGNEAKKALSLNKII